MMERKKLIYIIGGIAVIGIGYYLYKNRQRPPQGEGDGGMPPSGAPTTQPPTQQPAKEGEGTTTADLSKKEARKQSKSDSQTYMAVCGKRPSLKKNRGAWQSCVDEQKKKASATSSSPFEGASTSFDIYSRMTGELTDNMDIF